MPSSKTGKKSFAKSNKTTNQVTATKAADNRNPVASLCNSMSNQEKALNHAKFLSFLANLIGKEVFITLIDQRSFKGIFHTANIRPGKDFAICLRVTVETTMDSIKSKVAPAIYKSLMPGTTAIFHFSNILEFKTNSPYLTNPSSLVSAKPVKTTAATDIATDSSITNSDSAAANLEGRELIKATSWLAEDTFDETDISKLVADSLNTSSSSVRGKVRSNSTSSSSSIAIKATRVNQRPRSNSTHTTPSQGGTWDQFAANNKLFDVKSTFNETLYTTPLDISKLSKDQIDRAYRMEKEILKEASSNIHLREERGQLTGAEEICEEDMYSGVLKESNQPSAVAATVTKSIENIPSSVPKAEGSGESSAHVKVKRSVKEQSIQQNSSNNIIDKSGTSPVSESNNQNQRAVVSGKASTPVKGKPPAKEHSTQQNSSNNIIDKSGTTSVPESNNQNQTPRATRKKGKKSYATVSKPADLVESISLEPKVSLGTTVEKTAINSKIVDDVSENANVSEPIKEQSIVIVQDGSINTNTTVQFQDSEKDIASMDSQVDNDKNASSKLNPNARPFVSRINAIAESSELQIQQNSPDNSCGTDNLSSEVEPQFRSASMSRTNSEISTTAIDDDVSEITTDTGHPASISNASGHLQFPINMPMPPYNPGPMMYQMPFPSAFGFMPQSSVGHIPMNYPSSNMAPPVRNVTMHMPIPNPIPYAHPLGPYSQYLPRPVTGNSLNGPAVDAFVQAHQNQFFFVDRPVDEISVVSDQSLSSQHHMPENLMMMGAYQMGPPQGIPSYAQPGPQFYPMPFHSATGQIVYLPVNSQEYGAFPHGSVQNGYFQQQFAYGKAPEHANTIHVADPGVNILQTVSSKPETSSGSDDVIEETTCIADSGQRDFPTAEHDVTLCEEKLPQISKKHEKPTKSKYKKTKKS